MQKLTEILQAEADAQGLLRVTLSGHFGKTVKKISYTPSIHKKESAILEERFMPDGKALHAFLPVKGCAERILKESESFRQTDISSAGFSAVVLRSAKGALHIKYGEGSDNKRKPDGKNYILSPGEKYDFLTLLGIQDASGRVHDKKQGKFRQINRFLQIVSDVLPSLPGDGVKIWDLCCGKSYLSFAVYYYFRYVLGRNVSVYCVDLKADVIAECASYAEKLGWGGLHFICGDIFKAVPDERPDLVLSLHACDTATDMVLAGAVQRGARVILSSPCCQHELASQINSPELSYVTREPILKQKLAAVLTDALRCRLLYACGYKVTTLEFTDPEDTPKNLMIRAEKALIPAKLREAALTEYDGVCESLGAKPAMRSLLSDFLTKTR